jgi:hypothetical protein
LLASQLLDGVESVQRGELAAQLAEVLTGKVSVPALAERWQQLSWLDLLEWLSTRISSAVRSKLGGVPALDAAVARLAGADAEALFALGDHLRERLNQTRNGGNPNTQLAIEVILFHACEAVNKKSR